jgi:hypothetical protein
MENNNVSFILVYDPKVNTKLGDKPYAVTAVEPLVPYRSYVLLVLDYFAIYVPQMWLERFHFLKNLLHHEEKGWGPSKNANVNVNASSSSQATHLRVMDLTHDLHQCLYKTDDMVDFSLFPDVVFSLFQGHSGAFLSTKQRRVIRFLIPFVEFLAPSTFEVEYWRKKSQSYFLLADAEL